MPTSIPSLSPLSPTVANELTLAINMLPGAKQDRYCAIPTGSWSVRWQSGLCQSTDRFHPNYTYNRKFLFWDDILNYNSRVMLVEGIISVISQLLSLIQLQLKVWTSDEIQQFETIVGHILGCHRYYYNRVNIQKVQSAMITSNRCYQLCMNTNTTFICCKLKLQHTIFNYNSDSYYKYYEYVGSKTVYISTIFSYIIYI